jgi:hypothetical protein
MEGRTPTAVLENWGVLGAARVKVIGGWKNCVMRFFVTIMLSG